MKTIVMLVVLASDKIAFDNIHKDEYDSLCEKGEKGKAIPIDIEYRELESKLIEVRTTSVKPEKVIISAVKSHFDRSGKTLVRIEKVDPPKALKIKDEKTGKDKVEPVDPKGDDQDDDQDDDQK
jgi:hypothetical protein